VVGDILIVEVEQDAEVEEVWLVCRGEHDPGAVFVSLVGGSPVGLSVGQNMC
jgi:hypothetical protein